MKKIITLGAIILAFVIAIGGLFIMREMVLKNGDILLSEAGSVKAAPMAGDVNENVDAMEHPPLSKMEIIQILHSMESNEAEQPHEPMQGQISMEDAIEQAKEWTNNFYGQYLAEETADTLNYIKINPKLCIKQNSEITGNGSEVLNSYWTVLLETDKIRTEIVMNAVTAQVFRAKATATSAAYDFSGIDVDRLLDDYIASFHINSNNTDIELEGYVYREIEEKELYAITKTESIMVANKDGHNNGYVFENDLTLYLSTDLPKK